MKTVRTFVQGFDQVQSIRVVAKTLTVQGIYRGSEVTMSETYGFSGVAQAVKKGIKDVFGL